MQHATKEINCSDDENLLSAKTTRFSDFEMATSAKSAETNPREQNFIFLNKIEIFPSLLQPFVGIQLVMQCRDREGAYDPPSPGISGSQDVSPLDT